MEDSLLAVTLKKIFLHISHEVQVYVLLHVHLEAIFHRSWAEAMSFGDRKGRSDAVVSIVKTQGGAQLWMPAATLKSWMLFSS